MDSSEENATLEDKQSVSLCKITFIAILYQKLELVARKDSWINCMELIIFDCDGVLIDSEVIACSAEAEALAEIGYEISFERVVERFLGVSSNEMYAQIEFEMGRDLPTDFSCRVKQRISEKYRTELRPIDGIKEVLASLKTRNCVASSSLPEKLALGLIETGLFELLYPHIFSTVLVERGKPNPDLFLYSANALGVRPSACMVIEDSAHGITAARAAGMRAIGFVGGSHCDTNQAKRLTEAGAEAVIEDIRWLLHEVG